MPEMPTLGAPPKQAPIVPIALTAVVVGLLLGGIFWLKKAPAEAPPPPEPPPAVAEAPPPAPEPAEVSPFRVVTVTITGPLESAIVASEGKEIGAPLTQVVTRALVWWLRVPQDLVRGDTLSAIYETRTGQEPLLHAVRFNSQKLGRELATYRFKADGEPHARFYLPDGKELEERLVDSPIESYEQITSLLRDGRRHQGVDFKAPSGTPVKATFDAVVSRKNWNFRGNGNSVELRELNGGRTALYLHLSELPKSLAVGQKLKKGQVFAQSGNTGRSFAPHLHYQLMKGSQVLDPFEAHATGRNTLPEGARAAFEAHVKGMDARFPSTYLPTR